MTKLQRARELLGGLMMLAAGVLVICRPATGIRLIMLIIIVTMILKGLGVTLLIVFVGLVVISKLRNAWRSSLKDDYVSTLDMLDEMAPIRFCEYADGSGHMTPLTTKQVMISRVCNVEPPSECIPLTIQKPL